MRRHATVVLRDDDRRTCSHKIPCALKLEETVDSSSAALYYTVSELELNRTGATGDDVESSEEYI